MAVHPTAEPSDDDRAAVQQLALHDPTSTIDLIHIIVASGEKSANARELLVSAAKAISCVILSLGLVLLASVTFVALLNHLVGSVLAISSLLTISGVSGAVGFHALRRRQTRTRRRDRTKRLEG
jgi:hypothetical protein